MNKCKLGVISQERLKIEVKLLLSDNRKLYMPRHLAQQRMTLSDLKWPFHASRAISKFLVVPGLNQFGSFFFSAHQKWAISS